MMGEDITPSRVNERRIDTKLSIGILNRKLQLPRMVKGVGMEDVIYDNQVDDTFRGYLISRGLTFANVLAKDTESRKTGIEKNPWCKIQHTR